MHNTFDALDACPLRFGPHVMRDVGSWHIASFRCVAEFDRYRGIADMAGLEAGSTRSQKTPNGHPWP